MPRMIVPLVAAVILIGLLFFLSTLPKQQPTHPIEVAVTPTAEANAH